MDLSFCMKGSLQEKSCHNAHKSCGSFLPPSGPKILSQGDCPGEEAMSSVFRALIDTESRRLDLYGGPTVRVRTYSGKKTHRASGLIHLIENL